jgi:peptidoglycan/LPS O-acetylase OafA/YrhL
MNLAVNRERFNSIDFLRGVAILGVISIHTSLTIPTEIPIINTFFSMGAYGVQLFFLLSSITMCLMWESRDGEQHPIRNFYIRRIFRIAPLFWLAIPLYLSINGLEPSYWNPNGISEHQIILTALFLHGLYPDAINSVVPGGWSIAVEMTFYLLFPILILSFKKNARIYLYSAIIIWCINTLFLKEWITGLLARGGLFSKEFITDYLNLYFISQAPVFLVGCWLYFSLAKKISKTDLVLFALWIFIALLLKISLSIGGLGFLLIFLLLAVFIRVCLNNDIHLKPIEYLGRNSYAIYLVHFLVISFVYRLLSNPSGLIGLITVVILTTIISYLISCLTNLLIEGPFQKLAKKITTAR